MVASLGAGARGGMVRGVQRPDQGAASPRGVFQRRRLPGLRTVRDRLRQGGTRFPQLDSLEQSGVRSGAGVLAAGRGPR